MSSVVTVKNDSLINNYSIHNLVGNAILSLSRKYRISSCYAINVVFKLFSISLRAVTALRNVDHGFYGQCKSWILDTSIDLNLCLTHTNILMEDGLFTIPLGKHVAHMLFWRRNIHLPELQVIRIRFMSTSLKWKRFFHNQWAELRWVQY